MPKNMQKLPDFLLIPINRYGFLTIPVAVLLIVFGLLSIDGFGTLDAGIMVAALVGLFIFAIFWHRTHARQSPNVPKNTEALLNTISQQGKYAMVAFESEFCMSSTTVGKQLTELENTYPDRFQIYSVSVLKDPGKELFQKYGFRVTPTYVLLDAQGNVMMDYPLVLPVERVIYAVSQQASRV